MSPGLKGPWPFGCHRRGDRVNREFRGRQPSRSQDTKSRKPKKDKVRGAKAQSRATSINVEVGRRLSDAPAPRIDERRHSSEPLWVIAHVVEWALRPTSIVVTPSAATRSGHTLSRFRMLHRVRHYCLRPTLVVMSILILARCGLRHRWRRNQL
jgi:hypothetical protein